MVDKTIYVDPFLLKNEREHFVMNYKQMQKKKREANMVRTQNVYRSDQQGEISQLAANCFENNRILIIVRSHNMFSTVDTIVKSSSGKEY
jgi:ferredoxin-like protein FixX